MTCLQVYLAAHTLVRLKSSPVLGSNDYVTVYYPPVEIAVIVTVDFTFYPNCMELGMDSGVVNAQEHYYATAS